MDQEVTVTYTAASINESVKQQWFSLIGVSGFLLLVPLVAVVLILLFLGETDWVFGFFVACLVIYSGVIFFGYFRLRSSSMTKFRKMDSPMATFRFTEQGISIAADTGKTEVAWKLVKKVLRTPKVWVILIAGGGGITLPIDSLDEKLKAFILERAEGSVDERK